MSKINAVRIINLNYNHNTIRVDDEIWNLNGESTLFSLRNGGGKSVLVQMLTAPFVRKRYRSSHKERPFSSYFTTNKPTFILVEWQLDDQAGTVLTGMMVRKHQDSAEDEGNGEELDMINFICENSGADHYDIRNFPVISSTEHGRKLKGYKVCQDLFNQWKNDRQMKFFAYDMNQNNQARSYFSKLEEYRIYYKEWEEIISKVNLRESGLSELFADCKSERALVEKWFLKKIEAKLNKTGDRVTEFQHLMGQYIQQYQENRSKVEKRSMIQQFYEDAVPVQATAQEFQQVALHGTQLENRLAHLYADLSSAQQQAIQQTEELKQQQSQIKAEILDIQYDSHSWKIYQLREKEEKIEQERQQLAERAVQLSAELQKTERNINLLECAHRYESWCEASQDVQVEENRLELFKQDEKTLEPEREQIGYTLRCYYEQLCQELQEQQNMTLAALQNLLDEKEQLQNKLRQQRQQKQELYGEAKLLQERLRQYDKQEATFNRQYEQTLARNLLGAYEAGTLELMLQVEQQQQHQLELQITAVARKKEELRQQQHQLSRQREDLQVKSGRLTAELVAAETDFEQLKRELTERSVLVEHLGVSTENLFDKDYFVQAFQQRLSDLQEMLRGLRNQQEAEQQQYRRLEKGELLQLPAALEDALHGAGIDYIFGMEWLKRNGFSAADNQALLAVNPFIPYSLIMSKLDLQRLQQEPLGITTDFPVPIVSREMLSDTTEVSALFLREQIGFYILFDQRLLDQDSLAQLLKEHQHILTQLAEQLQRRQEEYDFYQNKMDLLKQQRVNQQNYTSAQAWLKKLEAERMEVEQQRSALRNEQDKLDDTAERLEKQIRQLDNLQLRQIEKCRALDALAEAYQQNQENLSQLYRIKENLQHLEKTLADSETQQQALEENRQTLLDRKRERQNDIQKAQEQLQQFMQYAECSRIEKDIEDLLSRYQAITQQVPLQKQEIEQQLQKTRKRFAQLEDDLLYFSKKCGLVSDDYRQIRYDRYQVDELELQRVRQQKLIAVNQESWQKCTEERTRLQERGKHQLEQLKEQLGYEMPRPKADITVIDFDRAVAEKEFARKQLEQQVSVISERAQMYQSNLESMAEFSEFKIHSALSDAPKLTEMKRETLSRFRGNLVREYRSNLEMQRDTQTKLYKQTERLLRLEHYQDDFFRQPLQTLLSLTATPEDYLAQLTVTISSYQQLVQKLEIDIALLDREKEKIIDTFFHYLREVHRQFGNIDRSSTISVQGRSLKMLKITLPDWDAQEEIYRARLQHYLEELTIQCLELLDANKNLEERLGARITTKELYDAVVGISNIQIQLYKIEEQQAYQIHWANVASNSGGEGFLSAFIVLASLLSFMRHQESDLFREREEGKVLLMDNPFAQTNAAHLLVPMMDIAKRANIQLICLSGLGGDSIYSRFDMIYVLTLTASNLVRGLEYLHGEQLKGSDQEKQTMISAYIATEPAEQIELF